MIVHQESSDVDSSANSVDVERREHPRLRVGNQPVSLVVDAEAADESFTGIGLIVDAGCEIPAGYAVQVATRGHRFPGVVRHVTTLGDGRVKLGVEYRTPVKQGEDLFEFLADAMGSLDD